MPSCEGTSARWFCPLLGAAPSLPSVAQASATGAALLAATVTMTGTVRTNKECGAGYSFAF